MSTPFVETADQVRERVAMRQREFVRALVDGGELPAGMDAGQSAIAAESLALKRRREVAHAWPRLAEELGDEFDALFDQFARVTPLVAEGGPLADGRAFVDFAARTRQLSDAALLERIRVDARYVKTAQGLSPRRSLYLNFAYLPKQRRVLLVLNIPRLGVYIV